MDVGCNSPDLASVTSAMNQLYQLGGSGQRWMMMKFKINKINKMDKLKMKMFINYNNYARMRWQSIIWSKGCAISGMKRGTCWHKQKKIKMSANWQNMPTASIAS